MFRSPDTYRSGIQVYPAAEQELAEWANQDRAKEIALVAAESRAEFIHASRPSDSDEDRYDAAESRYRAMEEDDRVWYWEQEGQ